MPPPTIPPLPHPRPTPHHPLTPPHPRPRIPAAAAECCRSCQSGSGCVAWTFYQPKGCLLLTTTEYTKQSQPGAVSGIVYVSVCV